MITPTMTYLFSYDYLSAIKALSDSCESNENSIENMINFDEFGLVYDCSGFPGLLEFTLSSVAGTMVAAKALVVNKVQVCECSIR